MSNRPCVVKDFAEEHIPALDELLLGKTIHSTVWSFPDDGSDARMSIVTEDDYVFNCTLHSVNVPD